MDANPTLMHDAELPEVMKNMTFFYIDSKVMIRWPKVLILALEMDPNGNTASPIKDPTMSMAEILNTFCS